MEKDYFQRSVVQSYFSYDILRNAKSMQCVGVGESTLIFNKLSFVVLFNKTSNHAFHQMNW